MNADYVLEQEKANDTIRGLWMELLDTQVEVSHFII